MKYLIIMFMTITTAYADVQFKVNSKLEQLSGSFGKASLVRNGNKIQGSIKIRSMKVSKKDKREDLLEYFDAKKHPTTTFKAKISGNTIEGIYSLKGKEKKLKGKIKNGQVTFKIPLTDLVTGFKAMFLGKKDHVEMKMEIK